MMYNTRTQFLALAVVGFMHQNELCLMFQHDNTKPHTTRIIYVFSSAKKYYGNIFAVYFTKLKSHQAQRDELSWCVWCRCKNRPLCRLADIQETLLEEWNNNLQVVILCNQWMKHGPQSVINVNGGHTSHWFLLTFVFCLLTVIMLCLTCHHCSP